MFRSVFRSAFRDTTRPVFGVGGGETPLQQAVIAAWDMQEASGPLIAAKGGVDIPDFNGPGTTAGPATGISARRSIEDAGSYFELTDPALFNPPLTGQKTVRAWVRCSNPSSFNGHFAIGNNGTFPADAWLLSTSGSSDWGMIIRGDGGRTSVGNLSSDASWLRFEYLMDQDSGSYRIQLGAFVATGTVFGGSFNQGSEPFIIHKFSANANLDTSLIAVFNRELTPAERTADETPTRFADLGKL